jgi:serine/threonine protein kinase
MDRFRVVRRLGKGSFGSAEACVNLETNEVVVIKRVDLSGMDEDEKRQAMTEAALLNVLRHPSVIEYREAFVQDDVLHIVMEYAEHGDLAHAVKQQKKRGVHFGEEQVLEWATQLCLGLRYIHSKRVLHRDLKTANCFLTRSRVKIGDFGISKVLETTHAHTQVGTPYFLSPEAVSAKPYGRASDVWALGCVVYELCALKRVFSANSLLALVYKIVNEPVPRIPSCYSDELADLVASLLEKDPAKRMTTERMLSLPTIRRTLAALAGEHETPCASEYAAVSSTDELEAALSSGSDPSKEEGSLHGSTTIVDVAQTPDQAFSDPKLERVHSGSTAVEVEEEDEYSDDFEDSPRDVRVSTPPDVTASISSPSVRAGYLRAMEARDAQDRSALRGVAEEALEARSAGSTASSSEAGVGERRYRRASTEDQFFRVGHDRRRAIEAKKDALRAELGELFERAYSILKPAALELRGPTKEEFASLKALASPRTAHQVILRTERLLVEEIAQPLDDSPVARPSPGKPPRMARRHTTEGADAPPSPASSDGSVGAASAQLEEFSTALSPLRHRPSSGNSRRRVHVVREAVPVGGSRPTSSNSSKGSRRHSMEGMSPPYPTIRRTPNSTSSIHTEPVGFPRALPLAPKPRTAGNPEALSNPL